MSRNVIGLDRVLFNINREIHAIEGRTLTGMIKAMEHLHTETETVSPKVPIDTSRTSLSPEHISDSWYIFPAMQFGNPTVFAGYRAQHAPAVHEMTGFINWKRPGAGAKWLQIHFERNRREMQLIIAQNAKIKI